MKIVPFYAGLLALLFVVLSVRVIRQRRSAKVAIGPGGHPGLERAMRVHANFAEYVPFAVVLLALMELQNAPVFLLHALGLVLLAGRLVHAYGVSQPDENFRFRVSGMMATFVTLLIAALYLLGRSLIG
jgi:uncharacterized membrane protein YecN with MAPEG domain